jgi:hypothetical protein
VSCPSALRYLLEGGVRLRPMPEVGLCLAYTPARPGLHRLNAHSWLIASLCDGRSHPEVAAAYREALGGAADDAALREGVAQLVALGLVRVDAETTDVEPVQEGERR